MLTFEDLHLKDAEDIFRKVDEACRAQGLEYYLIGAQAVNINLNETGRSLVRFTKDVDFAVLVPSMDAYGELRKALQDKGLGSDKEPYRLIHPETGMIVDILPFGAVETNGYVYFGKDFQLSVVGLREVNHYAENREIQGSIFRVSPACGLFLLKLIAFSDKPERTHDLDDIHPLLNNYFDQHSERFYQDHLDLVDLLDESRFEQEAGACLLGRDLREILNLSPSLKQTILDIFNSELADQPGKIGKYFVQKGYFDTWEDFKRVFSLIYQHMQ